MSFKITISTYVKQQTIKNLLNAHKRVADTGNTSDLIKLSKFILRLSKHFGNEVLDLGLEHGNYSADYPPDKRKENIP